jgi:hypothetical protein
MVSLLLELPDKKVLHGFAVRLCQPFAKAGHNFVKATDADRSV